MLTWTNFLSRRARGFYIVPREFPQGGLPPLSYPAYPSTRRDDFQQQPSTSNGQNQSLIGQYCRVEGRIGG
jgi:hypothetical protein